MKKIKSFTKTCTGLIILLVSLTFMFSCQATNSKIIVSHYRYDMDDTSFRIRSVNCEREQECYNELIAENFIAVDFNQDRIIDRIVMGEADLSEVQKIYEYGLEMLARENKLEEHVSDVSQYVEREPCCQYEMKSFRLSDTSPFNQFIITEGFDTSSPQTMVAIDQDADGTLDVMLKGSKTLEYMQQKYDSIINKGLAIGNLIKINGMILVKDGITG
jgi:hypothetical protein